MSTISPRVVILTGLALVVIGFVLSFLMFGRWVKPSFLLGFAAYATSVVGLVLGVVGAGLVVISNRKRE